MDPDAPTARSRVRRLVHGAARAHPARRRDSREVQALDDDDRGCAALASRRRRHDRQSRPVRRRVGGRDPGSGGSRLSVRRNTGARHRRERVSSILREPAMILERFKVPENDQVLVPESALRRTVPQIFGKLALAAADAADAADALTMTDLRGVETHGVSNMLRAYVRDYRAGKLDPRPGWRIVRESPGTAVIDAERRLGIVIGPQAVRLALDKARPVGVGVVTVYNSGHFGAIGHFAMQAAQHDMIGVCFTGASVNVVPTFASKPMIGTNPIAIAAPSRREAPMLFDAATSAIAGNKIR